MLGTLAKWFTQKETIDEHSEVRLDVSAIPGLSQMAFVSAAVSEWLSSPQRAEMLEAKRYFRNENDILKRTMKVIGRNGEMVEAKHLSNNKLAHSFLRKLTKQKIGYLLGKPFTVKSSSEEFQQILEDDYITKEFFKLVRDTSEESIVEGISWIQPYYDDEGILQFKHLPGTQIIPFWEDSDHKRLAGAIRLYEIDRYVGSEKTTERHVKYFTPDAVYNYMYIGNMLVPDLSNPIEYNFTLKTNLPLAVDGLVEVPPDEEDANTQLAYGIMWKRIPLIPIKYNSSELSLLRFIKSLIDDYDNRTSDMSNVLEDEPNRIKVVRNYDGTDKDDFIFNLAKYRTVFLRDNGEVSTLESQISTEALENHLTRVRKDIFEFGGGVDTQNQDLAAASGSSLKFVYADLDMDCAEFSTEISWALQQVGWFIQKDLQLKNKGTYPKADLEIEFNTDIAINETETVDNLYKSKDLISRKTLLEQHPYVQNATEEEKRLDEDQKRKLEVLKEETAITATSNTEVGNTG